MTIFDDIGLALIKQLSPEAAHTATIKALKIGLASKAKILDEELAALLRTNLPISGLELPNPLGIAAGFDKNAEAFIPSLNMGCGFVECGTVTPKSQPGNPKPRLFRLKEDQAVINRMGFNNEGLEPFVRRLKNGVKGAGIVGANVGANKTSVGAKRVEDYVDGIKSVWEHCSYVTLNISSPNTPGLRGLQNKSDLQELLASASRAIGEQQDATQIERPVFLKIAPDIDDEAIADIVDAVLEARGLTGIIVSNTTIDRPETLKSQHASQAGGLSGKPLFEKSTIVLGKVARRVDGRLDIIGVGGVHDAQSAYKKIRAGAHCFQLYSSLVYGGAPLIPAILEGVGNLLKADGFSQISDAVGADL
ncbi:quinone-dependent dihydroorotate dehydrogenase [Hirschia maritima]|uniref:quinone-dependent dihydroorotate dehydrogenase n=1 Tax=Hirschia maritima TaxID=1121961 RepID=UPI00035DAD8D|nr:quinone-dependent dihydroorotate dehydrogenase [Hirschia maritima]